MESSTITAGQQAAVDQQIGLAGAECNAIGCHVHLEAAVAAAGPSASASCELRMLLADYFHDRTEPAHCLGQW